MINFNHTVVTLLAFVYVPLNLATSLFSMNINEINDNGPAVWTFIITAIVAISLTATFWGFMEFNRKYVLWRKNFKSRIESDYQLPDLGYDFFTIFCLLVYLIRGFHRQWAWKTGIWIYVLTDDRTRKFRHLDDCPTRMTRPSYNTACNFITQHAFERSRCLDPSTSDSIGRWKGIKMLARWLRVPVAKVEDHAGVSHSTFN